MAEVHLVTGRLPYFVLVGAMLASGNAAAQALPPQIDAGAIGRENLRNQQDLERRTEPDRSGPAVVAPARAPAGVTAGGPSFVLTQVVFGRSAFLSPEELQALAAPYLNRPITLADVQSLLNAVNGLYTERGHVTASASLPPQRINAGMLRIDLVEGRLGTLTIEGADSSLDYVRRRLMIEQGSVIDVPRLTGDVATLNRTGETQLRTILQPGTQFGLTDVTISVTEPPRDLFQIFGDNLGVSTVGRYEGGALFQHYGMLGYDDRLKLYVVQSVGNASQNLSYTFGFNEYGGRIGLSYGRSDIHVIDGPFRDLNIKGGSQTGAVSIAQPVYGDANWLVLLNGAGAFSSSVTKQDTVRITDNLTSKGTVGFTASYYGDGFTLSVAPTYSYAHSSLAVVDRSIDFHLFGGSASAAIQLPGLFYFQALGSWQVSSTALLPGDQLFQIGGPTTLRGYPSNAVAGGTGYYGNFELHRSMSDLVPGWDLFAFVDHGSVYSTFPKRTALTSSGVGMSFTIDNRVTGELTAGFPLTTVIKPQAGYELYGRLIIRVF